jgi:hypothetical protein
MTDQTEPVRKSSLPCTPPSEYEFFTVLGARPDGLDGCMLIPGDMGPKVIRRRAKYGDWEPVRPEHWASEPESSVGVAATEVTELDKSSGPVADALAQEWHRRNQRLEELTSSKSPEAQVAVVEHVRGELIGLRGALGMLLGGQVQDGTADLLGWSYYQEWLARQGAR